MIKFKIKEFVIIKGKVIDEQTRCVHYHSPLDIIAIKFKCCKSYYSCYACHEEEAVHKTMLWNKNEFHNKAILCGNCKNELSIIEYLASDNICPFCKAKFNPKCSEHYHLYFER